MAVRVIFLEQPHDSVSYSKCPGGEFPVLSSVFGTRRHFESGCCVAAATLDNGSDGDDDDYGDGDDDDDYDEYV